MEDTGAWFDTALAVTRAGNLFTTHTPVAAGFDRFDPEAVTHYLGGYAERLGIHIDRLLGLGRADPRDQKEPFNMAYLAIRGCGASNGVSRLHGEVSREIFSVLFPRWPLSEVPIGHVTNGVHTASWMSPETEAVWTQACGANFHRRCSGEAEKAIEAVPDAALWEARCSNRQHLGTFVRHRYARQLAESGVRSTEMPDLSRLFDPNALTLGFARRFATYKRPDLLLRDSERLERLLTDRQRPLQIVVAGKAHPADLPGKALVQKWAVFSQRPGVRDQVIYLTDYDITLARHLVRGVDVWLNNPRRPMEASGTSGMKVLVNGGLNLSELDGWWAEAYAADVGWALGDGRDHGGDPQWDEKEANALYGLLEHEVVPAFYDRDADGIPRRWVSMIRNSMCRLTPRFSSQRTVREYTEQYYVPLSKAYAQRAAENGRIGSQIAAWTARLAHLWPSLRFGMLRLEETAAGHVFRLEVRLGELRHEEVRVEMFAEARAGDGREGHGMERREPLVGGVNAFWYDVVVPHGRPASDYTARAFPNGLGVNVPIELPYILWQR
jgi:glycogen phosphorylase